MDGWDRMTVMFDEEARRRRGLRIAARRQALGIRSHLEMSKQTGLARATIASAERGTASPATYAKLEVWLMAQEAVHRQVLGDGGDVAPVAPAEEEDRIQFEVTGPRTEWHVKVSGPSDQADRVRKQVVELMREWQGDNTP